jgi:hypothetical protein
MRAALRGRMVQRPRDRYAGTMFPQRGEYPIPALGGMSDRTAGSTRRWATQHRIAGQFGGRRYGGTHVSGPHDSLTTDAQVFVQLLNTVPVLGLPL